MSALNSIKNHNNSSQLIEQNTSTSDSVLSKLEKKVNSLFKYIYNEIFHPSDCKEVRKNYSDYIKQFSKESKGDSSKMSIDEIRKYFEDQREKACFKSANKESTTSGYKNLKVNLGTSQLNWINDFALKNLSKLY